MFFTCPNNSHSCREARNTDDDNAKQRKRKIEDNSNRSQPLACAQVSYPVFKQAEERPALHSAQRNQRCSRSNKRHFFNRTAGRRPYIFYGRNRYTCLNRPELLVSMKYFDARSSGDTNDKAHYHHFDPDLTIAGQHLQYLDDSDFRYLGRPTNVHGWEELASSTNTSKLDKWLQIVDNQTLPTT